MRPKASADYLPRFASTGRASGGLDPKGFYHQREERKGKRRKRARRARGKKTEKKRTSNRRKRRKEDEKHSLTTAKTCTRRETRDKEGLGKRKERRPREKTFLNALVWFAGARKSQNQVWQKKFGGPAGKPPRLKNGFSI